jgi:heme-degrading monooxygenase HmoA
MHAVITRVSVQEAREATDFLRERIVPAIKQAPGFVAGYWVRLEGGDEGCSTIVFESEDAARQASAQIRGNVEQNPGLTLHSVTVGEVVANA